MKFLFFQECFCTLLKFGIKVTGIFIFKIIKANDSPDLSVDMTCTPWSLQTQYWLPVVKVILDFLEEIWYIALFKCEPFQEKSHIILRPKQKLSANMASVKEIEWKKIKGWRFCSSNYNFLKDKGTCLESCTVRHDGGSHTKWGLPCFDLFLWRETFLKAVNK